MLVKDLKWIQQTAIALNALLSNHNLVAIIDTRSSGVVIYESCFKRLGPIQDKEFCSELHQPTILNGRTERLSKCRNSNCEKQSNSSCHSVRRVAFRFPVGNKPIEG